MIEDEEYNITFDFQDFFTDTKLTTKPRDNEDKLKIFNILKKIGSNFKTHNKGLNSARMKDTLYELSKGILYQIHPLKTNKNLMILKVKELEKLLSHATLSTFVLE